MVATASAIGVNAFTDSWQWPWGAGVVVLVLLAIGLEVRRQRTEDTGSSGSGPIQKIGDRSATHVSNGTVVTGDSNFVFNESQPVNDRAIPKPDD